MNSYVKSFVIGSSFPCFILYFLAVKFCKNKNYRFEDYVFIGPLFLGLMNMLSLYISKKYNLSLKKRMLGSSIFFSFFVFLFDYSTKQYQISKLQDWIAFYLMLFFIYFVVFNFIIYNLELLL
jgi:hypothetical protein